MQLFYQEKISSNTFILDEQESKHLIKSLRYKAGQKIYLTDGIGNFYTAIIKDSSLKSCELNIIDCVTNYEKRNYRLHIAIAPTKNIDRFEWFLEKATEIGVDEITPILSEHSERRVIKPERLERIIISAMKQSLKAYKPVLNPLVDFTAFINTSMQIGDKYVAHCTDFTRNELNNLIKPASSDVILIGPEGDFSPEEVTLATKNGFQSVGLGSSRLRTETAGIVACHTFSLANQKS